MLELEGALSVVLTDLNEFARQICYGASIKYCKSVSGNMYRLESFGSERKYL